MRFEVAPPQRGSILIVDLKQQTGFFVLPENKTYTELPPGKVPLPMPFFHPADPENACAAWESLAKKPGTCTKVGDGTINGRAAVEYKGTAPNGDTGSAWVDRKLSFVIKWAGQKGAAEFRNIKEGTQAATLFEIPKGYDRVDTQAARQESAKKRAEKAKAAAKKPQK